MICCKDPQITQQESIKVCENCGLVLEESPLVEIQEFDSGRFIHKQSLAKFMDLFISGVLNALKLTAIKDSVVEVCQNHISFGNDGKKSQAIAMCCIYHVLREKQIPLTIDELISVSSISRQEFNKAFNKIKWTLKTRTVSDTTITRVLSDFTLDLNLQKTVMSRCEILLKIGRNNMLDQGRRELPFIITVVYIGWLASSQKENQALFYQVGEKFGISKEVLSARFLEFKKLLIQKTKKHSNFRNKRNFAKLLPLLVDFVAIFEDKVITENESDVNQTIEDYSIAPPSFEKSRKRRNEILQKIDYAEKRICFEKLGLDVGELMTDRKDLDVEKCLKYGWKPEQIMQFSIHRKAWDQ